MKKRYILAICLAASLRAYAQTSSTNDRFGPPQPVAQIAAPSAIYATDLDGDGDNDILAASLYGSKIVWYENQGEEVFGPEQIISTDLSLGTDVDASDLDGDGDSDVLFTSRYTRAVEWAENQGNGRFGPERDIDRVKSAAAVYAADLDSDGDNDVVASFNRVAEGGYGGADLAFYRNDGNGGFSDSQVLAADLGGSEDSYATDLDGDGDLDIVASLVDDDDNLVWYENDGTGTFGERQNIATQIKGGRISLYPGDLDGDGDQDILATSSLFRVDGEVAWYENKGAGIFGEAQVLAPQKSSLTDVQAADLDGDGDQDVLTANAELAWRENDGTGTFGEPMVINDNASSVYATDLDRDGDIDVLSASTFSDNEIVWHENQLGIAPPPPPVAQIIGLSLYRSREDSLIATIEDGTVIDPARLARSGFSIEANVQGKDINRIDFSIQGPNLTFRYTEQAAPYLLFGHYGRNYFGPTAEKGRYILVADLYVNDANGVARFEQSFRVTFTIGNEATTSRLPSTSASLSQPLPPSSAASTTLRVYPNTFDELLHVVDTQSSEGSSPSVALRTLQGQTLTLRPEQITRQGNQVRINTQTIPAGHYVLQITSSGTTEVRHVIKRQ